MMKVQSLDFNIGYAFSKIEKTYIREVISNKLDEVGGNFWIPKCWFGLRPVKSPSIDLAGFCKSDMICHIKEVFGQLAPKYDLWIKITPDKQYIKFDYIIKKKPEIKKMTVNEIEKILGYKIEIVSGGTE